MSPTRAVRLNGWKRLGIVLSAFWLVGSVTLVAGDYLSGNGTFARNRLVHPDAAGATHNKTSGNKDLYDEYGVKPSAPRRAEPDLFDRYGVASPTARGGSFDHLPNEARTGAFDDLIPESEAGGAHDRKALTAGVREKRTHGQDDAIVRELNYRAVFLVVFVPVLVAWALAAVLVFSLQWVRAGFRDRAETTRQ